LHPDGIAVVLVDPGWVQTDMGGAEADLTPCEVAAGIVALAETLKFEQTGKFFRWNGKERAF
jgi:NAD(P)-dependent dehydrogenase (short-subunit alcohol dehydrogenase family)